MNGGREGFLLRYAALKGRLERLLYDYDPEGMGSTVAAPLDEYSDVATTLIRALRDHDTEAPLSVAIYEIVPGATNELVTEIERAWADSQRG
ncbi:MAG TPA: hypothetical protein VGB64_08545 [Actinomycetota bacterium]